MINENKIRYSDIIQPDDSFEKLIQAIKDVQQSFSAMISSVSEGANRLKGALQNMSTATAEGRQGIDAITSAALRLKTAQLDLKSALVETGKQIRDLKTHVEEAKKSTSSNQSVIEHAISSYNQLKETLKLYVNSYKELTKEQRENTEQGRTLLSNIVDLKNQIVAIDATMKPHIQKMTELEKAQAKLAFLQSEEGRRLSEVKNKINAVNQSRRKQKATTAPLIQAQQKLAHAMSHENEELKLYSILISNANKEAQLNAQIASSAEGSYNRLSAQYALNKIKLNQMSAEERLSTQAGKELEKQTFDIYQQMIKLQEATGKHTLSVGHYKKVWDGLDFSIGQVARELPTLAISLNHFFLAISNNIPMVFDEIRKVREQNKILTKEGKPTINVIKRIGRAFLSWNTVLVVVLTLLSMFGKQIISFVKNLFTGGERAMTFRDQLKAVRNELKENDHGLSKNIVMYKKLQQQYEKIKKGPDPDNKLKAFIEDSKESFTTLGVAITSVSEAEDYLVSRTDEVVASFYAKARAAAAFALAEETMKKILEKEATKEKDIDKLEAEKRKQQELLAESKGKILGYLRMGATERTPLVKRELTYYKLVEEEIEEIDAKIEEKQKKLKETLAPLQKDIDNFIKLGLDQEGAGTKLLGGTKTEGEGGRDVTNSIYRARLEAFKKYKESETNLELDEIKKRKKAVENETDTKIASLAEIERKLKDYIEDTKNKYKTLTEDEKKIIKEAEEYITLTISNLYEEKRQELNIIEIDERKRTYSHLQKMTELRLEFAKKGSQEELELKKELLKAQMEQEILENSKLIEEEQVKEADIREKYNKKTADLDNEYRLQELKEAVEFAKLKEETLATMDEEFYKNKKDILEKQLAVEKEALEQREDLTQAEINHYKELLELKYELLGKDVNYESALKDFQQLQKLEVAQNEASMANTYKTNLFKKQQELKLIDFMLDQHEKGNKKLTQLEIQELETRRGAIVKEINKINSFIKEVGKKGLGVTLLESLGFNDEAIQGFQNATNIIMEQLGNIMDAEIQLAEVALEKAKERTEAAQGEADAAKEAFDKEIEARNNGYANDVATTRKEWDLARKKVEQSKKDEQAKEKILKEAQKKKDAIDTVTQTSSLITASAQLWQSFSGTGPIAPVLAAAAIAAMWASFIAAKAKARQLASQSDTYGEGGFEYVEGGSHASGNDVELGMLNRKRHKMRVEGGEAVAVINRRNVKKYKEILPDVIKSINKGIFEEKYLSTFDLPDRIKMFVTNTSDIDISRIELDVDAIRRQNETRYYPLPDGSICMQYKNVKSIIKN